MFSFLAPAGTGLQNLPAASHCTSHHVIVERQVRLHLDVKASKQTLEDLFSLSNVFFQSKKHFKLWTGTPRGKLGLGSCKCFPCEQLQGLSTTNHFLGPEK